MKTIIEKTCKECGKIFSAIPQQVGNFCSHSCALKYLNKTRPEVSRNQLTKNKFMITSKVKDYIDGLLLGDGFISRPSDPPHEHRNLRYAQFFSMKFAEWCQKIVNDFKYFGINSAIGTTKFHLDNRTNKFYPTTVIQTNVYPQFKEFRNRWYPFNVKEVPNDIELSPITIKNWYLGDGSIGSDGHNITLCTESFSSNSLNLLLEKFKEIGFKFHTNKRRRLKLYKKEECFAFLEYLGEVPNCFKYKLGEYKNMEVS